MSSATVDPRRPREAAGADEHAEAGFTGASSPGELRRIDHVALTVRDADAAMDYYLSVLGLRLVHDERLPNIGVRLVYLAVGGDDAGAILQLVQAIGPGAVADFIAERGEALHHVCFAVADVARTLAGIPGEADATVFIGGRRRRCAFLAHQPNGILVELTEEFEPAP